MPGRQFCEEEIAHASRARRRPQGIYFGLQPQILRPQTRKLSRASEMFGADRAELFRVFFISGTKFVALLHRPKMLVDQARWDRRSEGLDGGKKIPRVERKDWECRIQQVSSKVQSSQDMISVILQRRDLGLLCR